MARERGLRTTVALTGAVLVLGVSVVLAALTGLRSRERIESEIGHSLAEAAHNMADRLDRSMWSRASEIGMLAKLGITPAIDDPVRLRWLLEQFQEFFPTVSWMGVTDTKGKVLAATGGLLDGVDISKRPVFQNGQKSQFVGDVHDAVMLAFLLPNPTGEAMKFVDISTPVHNERGEVVGVLATHLSWEWTREIRRSLMDTMRGRAELELIVVAADRTVLLGPRELLGTPLDIEAVRSAQKNESGWIVERWPDGERYLTGYAYGNGYLSYPGLGWSVVARQPLAVAYAPATAQMVETVLAGGAMVLLFSVLGWMAAGRVTRPLRRIAQAAERIRSGERGAEMPVLAGSAEITSLSATLRDLVDGLTHRDAALVRLEDIAYQDRLTGLPNRRYFEQYVEATTAGNGSAAFLYIDLDGFKPVNDRLGHDAGDLVLRQVGERLAACFRGDDVVARLGGDEFAAVLPQRAGAEPPDLDGLARRIIDAVNEPVSIQGEAVRVGCSLGIALWPEDSPDVAQALRRADQALYQAKRAGRNRGVRWSADLPPAPAESQGIAGEAAKNPAS
ncbi:GGDEF domain-containing protein (plasmid) [Azospirillum baldaniorum]|uniref:Diguanylate cyclase (GGDEF domain) n=1 Tax=Azospirillum baldaniorum TaxID=1064539 RepID=A0A9P1NPB0_9PROT|nr:GGDEF domain-containing protein [Azospirillum baldaniorum]AWJ91809.1 GGDEF domain-containing protein [Azospirillum baldaniorum]TWA53870.1 diguanylate cyclase (GGDEF)-like protein [Azospirillum baldaniorum]TWA83307.1 diguanylate cyclase (GGDEF)-like protein [Azospirillum brasilense]CCD00187.1 putative diguanylate cyclase (GGDEF domain) [Azospirillum baldaniorum]